MKKYIFAEIGCFILAALFVFSSVLDSRITDKSASELFDSCSSYYVELSIRDEAFVKEHFKNDFSVFSDFVYVSSDDVMNVSELFIGKFDENADSSSKEKIMNVFKDYVSDRYNLFNGYAPLQASVLDSYIMKADNGVLFFCIDSEASEIYGNFSAEL